MRRRLLVTLTTSPVSVGSILGVPLGLQMLATEVFAQMQAGAAADIGYVMDCTANPIKTDGTLNVAAAIALAVQLSAATSSTPGGSYGDLVGHPETGQRIDLNQFYVAGAHAGDKMLVQWWQVN